MQASNKLRKRSKGSKRLFQPLRRTCASSHAATHLWRPHDWGQKEARVRRCRYDMKYDSRYSSFKLVEGLAMALGLSDEPPGRETDQGG